MTNKLIHVGCGQKNKSNLKGFNNDDWQEIRVDIDPAVKPDIIGSLTNLSALPKGGAQALYSSHNLEHLYPHQVPEALTEFSRVLGNEGVCIITCPDLQSVCEKVAEGKLLDPLYTSPSGPIAAIDIIYGLRTSIANGNEFMAHRCGFTYQTLNQLVINAGFQTIIGGRRPKSYDIWLLATKNKLAEAEIRKLAIDYLP
jgi:hypothetical protein